MNEEQIFAEAIEKAPAERAEYLDKVCADSPDLRVKVEGLLAAHENPDSFLEDPVAGLTESLGTGPLPEKPGTRIGPYKLREKLGEGGMGVVWAAEQVENVHRKVALKVIKPGMDTDAVIARFEAERQALALMGHPIIPKVSLFASSGGHLSYFQRHASQTRVATYKMTSARQRTHIGTHCESEVGHEDR
jgi:serine/threonine-protein kinase